METIDYNLTERYISDDSELCEKINKLIQENQVILLVAPQGTGKSEYLKKIACKKMMISPTVATAEQVEESSGFNKQRGKFESTFKMEGKDRFGNPIERDYSSTFSSAKGIVSVDKVREFDMLIVDEVHKIVQYSDFAYDQVVSILKTIYAFIDEDKKVILTTATPQLLICLSAESIYNKIDAELVIKSNKEYISECIVFDNLSRKNVLISLLRENATSHNFQIGLVNDKEKIKSIAKELNKCGISTLSVSGEEFRNNTDNKTVLVKQFQKADYGEYQVLLATSWIDVGLNFIGDNITALYCVFDDNYKTGDFTMIQQFIARTRNSKPKLYINNPQLSKDEYYLINEYSLSNGLTYFFNLADTFKEIADYTIDNFTKGLIKDIVWQNYYGTYKNIYHNGNRGKMFKFSYITLYYQLYQVYEKKNYIENKILQTILNISNIIFLTDDDILNKDLIRIDQYLERLYVEQAVFKKVEFKQQIDILSYGRLKGGQPKNFVNTHFNDKWKLDDVRNREERLGFCVKKVICDM